LNKRRRTVLTIRRSQFDVFEAIALGQFEDRMVEHVRTYFPNHFAVLGDVGVRSVIRHGHARAGTHGLDTQRSVCLFINAMLLMGSNFDVDAMYPWAREILSDGATRDQQRRADRLSETSLRVFFRIAGPMHRQLNRALLNLKRNSMAVRQQISQGVPGDLPQLAQQLFPTKAEVVGLEALRILSRRSVDAAQRHGFAADAEVLLYGVLMFMVGSGFDTDPQYPRLRAALTHADSDDAHARFAALYAAMQDTLDSVLVASQG
jgi:hypothetical protein